MKLNKLNTAIVLFFSIILIYLLDFYILENNGNDHFWCVQIVDNFSIRNFDNIRLPIHCDEGTYRLASVSLDNFFDRNNPYQGRPLFVGFISILTSIMNTISFIDLSDYQQFKIAIFIVQFTILFFIVRTFISISKFKQFNKNEYIVVFLLCSIPGIRWNIFFPSVGNLTFLFFLISLKYLLNKNLSKKEENHLYIIFGLLSLAHLSAIIYGLIVKLYFFIKKRKLNKNTLFHLIMLTFPYILYRQVVSMSKYEYYDWHRSVYNQFYWLLEVFQPNTNISIQKECQTLSTFLKCNNLVTNNYLGYFAIVVIYFFILIIINKYDKNKSIEVISKTFFICSLIFIFWSFQGYYEFFRFTNYSIGYFLFTSLIFFGVFVFKDDTLLFISLLIYVYSVPYLEPYNEDFSYPRLNYLTVTSILLFMTFIYRNLNSKKI